MDCTILRFDESKILPDYFVYLTLTDEYYIRINESITGASRKRISRTNLGSILIPLPDLDTQKKIVSEINGYQKEIEDAILKISEMEFKSKEVIEKVW